MTQGQNTNNKGGANLQILDNKRDLLAQGLIEHSQYLELIPVNKQEAFRNNFLELATQDYLLSNIEPKELIRFTVNVTKIGLDIAPSAKEVYILPFDTTINQVKVMLPQAIVPLNGMQQLAHQKGFFLTLDAVWKFDDGNSEADSKLSRSQQAQLQTANPQWVEEHFIGFDVVLKDLKGQLPEQTKFVDINYVKQATKTIKDARWKLQTWRHKAVRRAYGDFMIPRDRKIEAFEEIENLNDSVLGEAEIVSTRYLTQEIEDAVKQLGLSITKNDGVAIVAGKTFGKDKTLANLGFVYENNTWTMTMQYQNQEQAKQPEQQPKNEKPKGTPAGRLTAYLQSIGLEKDEIGVFVKDVLGLTSSDTQGLEAVISNKKALDEQVQAFIAERDEAEANV